MANAGRTTGQSEPLCFQQSLRPLNCSALCERPIPTWLRESINPILQLRPIPSVKLRHFQGTAANAGMRQACYVVIDLMAVWLSASVALSLRFSVAYLETLIHGPIPTKALLGISVSCCCTRGSSCFSATPSGSTAACEQNLRAKKRGASGRRSGWQLRCNWLAFICRV